MRNMLERVRPAFAEGGKLAPFSPIFHALDNFIFAAGIETTNPPHGRDPLDVKRIMALVIVALLPAFIASVYFFGYRILLALLVSYAAGGIVEVTFAIIRKKEISEGFLVTGFLFPLIVPPGLPLWIIAVGVAFGVLVGKEVFGGTGRNLFNPALVGRVFIALGYPSAMTGHWLQPATGGWGRLLPGAATHVADAVASATPLVLAKSGTLASPMDLFLGRVTGSAGETSALAILIGGIFLVVVGIGNWRTVVAVIGTFATLSALFHAIAPNAVGPRVVQPAIRRISLRSILHVYRPRDRAGYAIREMGVRDSHRTRNAPDPIILRVCRRNDVCNPFRKHLRTADR